MRVSVIETEEEYNGGVRLNDITYHSFRAEIDYESWHDPDNTWQWKKSKDKGTKYIRQYDGNIIIILETSPYFNLIMFDSVCLESSEPRLKEYGNSDNIIDLLAIIKVPVD